MLKRLRLQGFNPKPWSSIQQWATKHHLLPVLQVLGVVIMEGTHEALGSNGYKADNGRHIDLAHFRNSNHYVRSFNLGHIKFAPRRAVPGTRGGRLICTQECVADTVLKLQRP